MYSLKLESLNKGQTLEVAAPWGPPFVKTKCEKESHSILLFTAYFSSHSILLWGWFWSHPSYFSLLRYYILPVTSTLSQGKQVITPRVPFCALVNTTGCSVWVSIWTTTDTTARTGWGWPGNTWQKDWKLIKWKTLWSGMLQCLLLRSADWSKGNLPSWIQTQKIPGESWARSGPLYLGSLSSVNVYLLFWNDKLSSRPVFRIFICWSTLILCFQDSPFQETFF